MRASNIVLCFVLLGEAPSGSCSHHPRPAFINHVVVAKSRPDDARKVIAADDALFDAEEAAAVDAHDVSDPGIEGAAMERAVIMAEQLKAHQLDLKKEERKATKPSLFLRIKSLFHHDDEGSELMEVRAAEAKYAQMLSDTAAMEHVEDAMIKQGNDELYDIEDIEAIYAHDLSDIAALEHVNAKIATYQDEEEDVPHQAKNAASRVASVEEHYKSLDKDIHTIERLIQEAARHDHSEGRSLERTFSDDDASELALMMIEKSVLAATDKLELCMERARQTEDEVKSALEEKYSAKALAESVERERRAAEMRFLSTEHFGDDANVIERRRDSSILHADSELLADALRQEHDAELKLEKAIEHDIAAKKELEQMIENKAALKQEFHDLEEIIHERTLALWEKENAKKQSKAREPKKEHHHFDWWHRKY